MTGSIVLSGLSPWSLLLRRLGLGRGPRRRSPLGLHAGARPYRPHAEVFMSERTGEWIRVGCDCRLASDHWHTSH